LIDGHNLIPKLGLRLDSPDDELELIALLQAFCRLERRQVDVYFDGAPAEHAGTRKVGTVAAHFVPRGRTADNAIRSRLKKLGKAAKNWTVVTSDRQVQSDARSARAEVVSSDEFARTLKQAMNSPRASKSERVISENEIEEWMDVFKSKKE
jgi:predicted RNA-binding protein with PIN domain